MIFVVLSGLVLLLLTCWFVFTLLAAVEKTVRAVHSGTPEDKINVTSKGMQAAAALAILVFILVYMLRRI